MSAACRRGTSKEDEMTSHCLMWAGPLEDDDLLSEILLRLPPQPSSLLRASLVCKRWRHLISDCGFFHRFRLRHLRNPPLLGFFSLDRNLAFLPTLEAPNRVPPERFSLQSGDGHGDRFFSLGCRHGLVLISKVRAKQVLVWDPVTGNQHHLDIPRVLATHAKKTTINGAVFRATGDIQQFHVVLTVVDNSNKHKRALAWVDSSDTGLWGDPISTPVPSSVLMINDTTSVFIGKPAVLAGGCLYWILAGDFIGILEFELERQSLDVIRVPVHMLEEGHYLFLIMRAEGGGLGLLFQTNPGFQLWKRKTGCDGVASWGLGRIIELDKLLSSNGNEWQMILGFAEENNVVLVWIACVLLIYGLS